MDSESVNGAFSQLSCFNLMVLKTVCSAKQIKKKHETFLKSKINYVQDIFVGIDIHVSSPFLSCHVHVHA